MMKSRRKSKPGSMTTACFAAALGMVAGALGLTKPSTANGATKCRCNPIISLKQVTGPVIDG
jgi:hypothetical protein